MHYQDIQKMFQLEEFVIEKIENNSTKKEEQILIYVHSKKKGMWYEQEYTTNVNTTRIRQIRHAMLDRKQVILVVTQRKFYFPLQKKRLWEKLPGINKYKQTSQEFRKETVCALHATNYSGAATQRGTSVMFPIRLLEDLPDDPWCKKTTIIRRIGLDGKGVMKHKQVFSCTNLDTFSLLGVLPQMSQSELITTLKTRIPEEVRINVEEVCIDMDTLFVQVIRQVFPHARIVIDHFHIIAWALHLLDEQKRIYQKLSRELYGIKQILMKPSHTLEEKEYEKLKRVFEKHPDLKRSWKIVQQLRKVYWKDSYKEAHSQLRYVIWLCEQSFIPEMQQLAKSLRRWFYEILAYYRSKTTNAFTEGIHTRFELIKRHHFGISNIPRFTKRLLYTFMPLSLLIQTFVQLC